ncbi:MAG: TCR/Tet family MFS transporter [Pseudomonadota bacterium]
MRSRLPLVFILLTMVLDAMGIGLILPVMPDLIRELEGASLSEAAVWGGLLTTVFAVLQFLFAPLLGALSDRYGRRPVLFASLFVLSLDYLVMAVAGTIWLLLVGRVVGGIATATQAVAYAYMADISKPEEKAARFGLIGAAFGLGFVLGPLIGGLLGELGTRAPFYVAAALAALNLAFGLAILPETVTDRIRRPLEIGRANPLGAFRALGRLPGIRRLVVMFFLYQVAFTVYPAIWAYFTQARFGWEPGMIGVSLASFGIAMALVQGTLVGPLIRRLGERVTVLYGLSFNAFAFLVLATVSSGMVALLFTPLTALGAVVTPALQGLMSRAVEDDAQGELQGVLTSAGSLAMACSPILMTTIFYAFTSAGAPLQLPGAPFLLSMALMGACAVVFMRQNPAIEA